MFCENNRKFKFKRLCYYYMLLVSRDNKQEEHSRFIIREHLHVKYMAYHIPLRRIVAVSLPR